MRRKAVHRRGVTIVETVIALAILTFGAAGIFEAITGAGMQGRRLERSARRDLLAYQRLHEILAAPYGELAAWKPSEEAAQIPGEDPYLWKATVLRSPDGLLHVVCTVAPKSESNPSNFAEGQEFALEGVKAP